MSSPILACVCLSFYWLNEFDFVCDCRRKQFMLLFVRVTTVYRQYNIFFSYSLSFYKIKSVYRFADYTPKKRKKRGVSWASNKRKTKTSTAIKARYVIIKNIRCRLHFHTEKDGRGFQKRVCRDCRLFFGGGRQNGVEHLSDIHPNTT